MKRKDWLLLLLLTLAGLLVHGYHPGAEDSETYLPGILKMLHPELFPAGSPYFLLHAHLTFFPNLIAASIRITHLPWAWALFLWHLAAIFLFLLACWSLMQRAFEDAHARWCGVVTMTALLTLPVAGTALNIMDQYINPRNLIAFAVVFAVVKVLDRKYLEAAFLLIFAGLIHPFMTVFAASFCLLLGWMERMAASLQPAKLAPEMARAAGVLSSINLFEHPSPAYERVADSHRYQFLVRWRWFELLGALAPLAILYWFSLVARTQRLRALEVMCRALVVYGALYFVAGMIVSIPASLAALARLQPMRSLYLLYVLFFLFAGGFIGQFLLKNHVWRWLLLFLPLCLGMYAAQRSLFPASAHLEWPWAQPRNPWGQAFAWVRQNTPSDAIFALDPFYMHIEGEDEIGFRAVAQRSHLADAVKDSGVVEMFPQIGTQWLAEVQAQTGIDQFREAGFERLQSKYGVGWVVLPMSARLDQNCPYRNQAVKVCRLR